MTQQPSAPASPPRNPLAEYLLLLPCLLAFVYFTARDFPLTTTALVVASVLLFLACLWAAQQLLGRWPALAFAALATAVGWFAEQMGSSHGWFFGQYAYTDVLGIQMGDVPLVIPIMWFALCLIGYVMACFLLWRQPVLASRNKGAMLLTSFLAAMIVTAFDLGADPYFVFVLKAWIMAKTDGGWFGETLQGFVGWMFISFVIVLGYQWCCAPRAPIQPTPLTRRAALIALLIYASGMAFQMVWGHPIETRAIAFFAMGTPLLVATATWWQWKQPGKGYLS